MNGAELPGGSILNVEPSDPLYKLRKKKTDQTPASNYYGPASETAVSQNDGNDELDDFFDSLGSTTAPKDEQSQATKDGVGTKGADEAVEKDVELDDFFNSL